VTVCQTLAVNWLSVRCSIVIRPAGQPFGKKAIMAKRQCLECGGDLVLAYHPSVNHRDNSGTGTLTISSAKWRCAICGLAFTAAKFVAELTFATWNEDDRTDTRLMTGCKLSATFSRGWTALQSTSSPLWNAMSVPSESCLSGN